LGDTCFKVKSKEVTLVIDPPSASGGFEADIICLTQSVKGLKGIKESKETFVIDGPGEYEVSGVTVFGIHAQAGNKEQKEPMAIYSLEIEDFYLAHLGVISQKLNDEQVSELEGVDILMVPIGGAVSVGPKKAVEVVEQTSPSIVIPMDYSDSTKLEKFFEEMEAEAPKPVEKLKLKSRNDLPEERKVVILECKG